MLETSVHMQVMFWTALITPSRELPVLVRERTMPVCEEYEKISVM